jgi:sugar/nucleoside kinase (ribokinase family)
VPRFEITIAGELNLDLVMYGLPAKLPLERELLASNFQLTLGSSSAILAHNLAVLGRRVGFISLIGNDELGELALARLSESGADISRVKRAATAGKTGVTFLLNHGARRRILTFPGTMSEMCIHDLDMDYLADSKHFHLSSLFLHKALQSDLPDLLRELRSRGLTVSLDTNDDPDDMWGGVLHEILPLVEILFCNERELLRIAGKTSLQAALSALTEVVPLIAVKRGPRGCLLHSKNESLAFDGLPVTPVDTIGAGDSFNAGFLSTWVTGGSLMDAAKNGNIAGALSVLRPGGTEAFRDREFCSEFLRAHETSL